ncbi:MAG TPA: DEAD/DEAH box helicase [Thermococcaceae archaeon]|nr:DEAD/DEAH box helicase [Thermococcaceae archaeon]
MEHWAIQAFGLSRLKKAINLSKEWLLRKVLAEIQTSDFTDVMLPSNDELEAALQAIEIAAIDLMDCAFFNKNSLKTEQFHKYCEIAFLLCRALPVPEDIIEAAKYYMRMSCFALLGQKSADIRRWLHEHPWPPLPLNSIEWDIRVFAGVAEAWLRLVRKNGWKDLQATNALIVQLRKDQSKFEKRYLFETAQTQGAALELVALYHLAKAIELLAIYSGQGEPKDILEQLDFHFDRSLSASRIAGLIELELLLRWLKPTAKQIAMNCIWMITRAYNSRITKYVSYLTNPENTRPIFELLPPQRKSLLEEGLLDPAKRAIVIDLPTSSGKTLLAQFRILQALNQFAEERGWVAYLVPTRALVNQICQRLRRDFAPLQIKVEKVSPALEVDSFEEELLKEDHGFEVLVTTPEKMDLMIRRGWEKTIGRPLTLVVLDEAHNIANEDRGIKIELLLSTINRECKNAQFLLLTPYIPNGEDLAKWLDVQNSQSISLGMTWKPNERAIGIGYPLEVAKNEWQLGLRTLYTSQETIQSQEKFILSDRPTLPYTFSQVRETKLKIAAAIAKALQKRGTTIVLAERPDWAWSIARTLSSSSEPKKNLDARVRLVQNYIKDEMGEEFELVDMLECGIGVHHAGLSDETRFLMEWLIENNLIDILVATTTIAQGVNFPVNSIVLSSHRYPFSEMPPEDFWNLAGRAGRLFQKTLGLVVFACREEVDYDIESFVQRQVGKLVSVLEKMVEEIEEKGREFDLKVLCYDVRWSSFTQYLAHTYRQINDHQKFLAQTELILRGTFGYRELEKKAPESARKLLNAVKRYADDMKKCPGYLSLADQTGFSPLAVAEAVNRLKEIGINKNDWHASRLFSGEGRILRDLIGVMLSVPELKKNFSQIIGGDMPDGRILARITRDWVSGESLPEIAKRYFQGDDSPTNALTKCCKAIYGNLIHAATWGVSSLTAMSVDFDALSAEEQRHLRNLPAMIYYGVDSEEAVLLRMMNVPRKIAKPLSLLMKKDFHGKYPTISDARKWLASLSEERWQSVVPKNSSMTGKDYQKIWQLLNGEFSWD